MASIFTKIITGEIPSYKVAENDRFYAFLDISPLQKGHTLVVPKQEEDYIFDLTDEAYTELMLFSKQVARAIKKSVDCRKVGIAVIGLEVPHVHVHLVPMQEVGDLNFANPKKQFSPDEMQECADLIASNM